MHSPHKEIADLIISRRKELKIKQEELAELSQIALRTLRDIEKGKGNPSVQSIQRIIEVLGIEMHFRLRK